MRLWIAQRTPERELLGETPPIRRLAVAIPHRGAVILEAQRLAPSSITRLARRDGFREAAELFGFVAFYHGFPFEGFVYRW